MTKMIEVKNLSKKYTIYHEQQSTYGTLVETLSGQAKKFFNFGKNKKNEKNVSCYEDFWALKDVNFSVDEGDRLAIIGKNGAGKSTLLKTLARITEPTNGCIKIRKRISYLLEVGTGFHPELTGRENIYLNGAILGMTRQEIKKKFDSIIDFAEVEQFLDTPIKRFSTGMYTRLGFAVAAHLDPEVLIVDEVLAVGDVQFQEKCLKKLNELSNQGRTIVFVSHDLSAVLTLCNKGLYLEKGSVKESGSIESCVNAYVQNCAMQDSSWKGVAGDEHIRFSCVSLHFESSVKQFAYRGENVRLDIEYEILKPTPDLVIGVEVLNQRHQLMARSYTYDDPSFFDSFLKPRQHRVSVMINSGQFYGGDYLVKLECFIHNKKNILNGNIVLKLPIYAREGDTRFSGKDGVALGNSWVVSG